ncbi:MAG: GNAT family N-acetyltransferase [Phenylobacterium sp.]|uniref:GNAT family N-acetyltransferase n=1 Tax=Phenylobacterium sp. TaxID=1871053 RepID=UPI00391BAAE7
MLSTQIIHPTELSPEDEARWRRFASRHEAFGSPLLGPDFARAVGAVRGDARVAIWRRDGQAVGFLAHHRRPGAAARPIGAPLSDYHGLVGDGSLRPSEALAAAGLPAFRFSGLVDPQGLFQRHVTAGQEAFVIRLDSSAEDYLEALRADSPKRFKNYRRLEHKIEREVGPLSLTAPDGDAAAFGQLLAWKREQLVRTGAHDFLSPAWTQALLRNLFEAREGDFQGLMITLRVGGRLIAGQFGVRLGAVFHPWIASTDPEMAAWSPGQLFFLRAIAAMPGLKLTTYDLGPGHAHYKAPFALSRREIAEGTASAAGFAGLGARMGDGAWKLAAAGGGPIVGRVRRRFETISALEQTLQGRVRGMAAAVAAKARSGAQREG